MITRIDHPSASLLARLFHRFAWTKFATALAAVFVFTLSAVAQSSSTGVVTGRVSNAATQKYLQSAEVVDKTTRRSAYTDADGSFILILPEGDRTIVVNYGGLDSKEVAVTVVAGETTRLDVPLTSAD